MPLQTTHALTVSSGDYKDQLLAVLRITERFEATPYIDKVPSPAIATIGYGFNIETVSAYMALTLNQLGILGNKPAAETQQILGEFIVATTAATGPTKNTATNDLQAKLNPLAQKYGVSAFTISEPQARTIYNQILEGATIAVTSGSPLITPGKQARLDAILGHSLAHNTLEYVALMSLFYNAESLVASGSQLATAVINGNCAEAWFQIRYKSNAGAVDVASRRYQEAHTFGLYDGQNQPVNDSDAINAIRTLREPSHFATVEQYEARHRLVGTTGFREQLVPAYQRLITNFGLGRPIEEALVAITALGGDPIQGGETNDLLLGDIGNDILIGGGGDDFLRGEGGKDVYVYNSSDGEDMILDTDGQGLVVFDHHLLQGGLKKQSEGVYKSLATPCRAVTAMIFSWAMTMRMRWLPRRTIPMPYRSCQMPFRPFSRVTAETTYSMAETAMMC